MKRVLLCRFDNVGDVLLTGPAVRAVAAGSDHVTYLAGPNGAEAAALLPGVDEVITHRAAWIDPDGHPTDNLEVETLLGEVTARRPTHGIVFTSFHQSPLPAAQLLRMAGVTTITAISDDYPGSLLDVRHRIDPDVHEVERNLSLAATLGFRLPAQDDGRLHVLLGEIENVGQPAPPFVVVHPGASASARTAAPELFSSLVDILLDEGWRVAVTGGQQEVPLTEAVAGKRHGVIDLGGRTGVRQLGAVLHASAALITGNTGPAHLAAAVGTPVVQIFPPTVPATRWHPWAVPHALIGNQDISCAGCRASRCPLANQICVSDITAGDVVAAMRKVISDRDYLFPGQAVGEVVA